jgi:hypothetical protein
VHCFDDCRVLHQPQESLQDYGRTAFVKRALQAHFKKLCEIQNSDPGRPSGSFGNGHQICLDCPGTPSRLHPDHYRYLYLIGSKDNKKIMCLSTYLYKFKCNRLFIISMITIHAL